MFNEHYWCLEAKLILYQIMESHDKLDTIWWIINARSFNQLSSIFIILRITLETLEIVKMKHLVWYVWTSWKVVTDSSPECQGHTCLLKRQNYCEIIIICQTFWNYDLSFLFWISWLFGIIFLIFSSKPQSRGFSQESFIWMQQYQIWNCHALRFIWLTIRFMVGISFISSDPITAPRRPGGYHLLHPQSSFNF